jgi:secondary thiamine-phosphate synthase enzyme
MKVYREEIAVKSLPNHPTFHELTPQVREILDRSGIKNGICVVYSHHTTCSVMTQESSHDQTYYGLEYLQQDLVDVMEKLVPQCTVEGQYRHPGPKHIDFAMNEAKEVGAWTSLNTDAHLRSVFFGRSETVVIVDGALDLGEFGYVYFVDWDQIRDRHRVVQVQIMGE